jgi:hypothetical protein
MIRHIVALVRSGQLRFRAETFGLYHPGLPDERPPWHLAMRGVWLLFRGTHRYAQWRRRMSALAAGSAHDWWGQSYPAIDLEGAVACQAVDDPPGELNQPASESSTEG